MRKLLEVVVTAAVLSGLRMAAARADAGTDLMNMCTAFINPTCLNLGVGHDMLACPPDGVVFEYNTPKYIIEVVHRDGDVILGEPFSMLAEKALGEVGPAMKYAVLPVLGAALGTAIGKGSAEGAALGAAVGSVAWELKGLEASPEKIERGLHHVRKAVHVYKIDWDPWSMIKVEADCAPSLIPDYPVVYPVYLSEADFLHWNTGVADLWNTTSVGLGGTKLVKRGVPRVLERPFEKVGPYGDAYPSWGLVQGMGNTGQAEVVLALRGLQRAKDLVSGMDMKDVHDVLVAAPGKLTSGACINPNMPVKDWPKHVADFAFIQLRSPRGLVVIVFGPSRHCVDKETYACGLKVVTQGLVTFFGCPECAAGIEGAVQAVKASERVRRAKEFYDKVQETYREYKKYIQVVIKMVGYALLAYDLVDTYKRFKKNLESEHPEVPEEIRQVQTYAKQERPRLKSCMGIEQSAARAECLRRQTAEEHCTDIGAVDREACVSAAQSRMEMAGVQPTVRFTGRELEIKAGKGSELRVSLPEEDSVRQVQRRARAGGDGESGKPCLSSEVADSLRSRGLDMNIRVCPRGGDAQ